MMEYGDSIIRAEWDALMEREREAAHEGTGDLRPPFFVSDTVVEIHKIVKAKVGAVEVERIVEGGSGHIPDLDSLLRAKRAAHREREREAAKPIILDAIWRVVVETVAGDERVAACVVAGSKPFLEAVTRACGPREKPGLLVTVNRIVLALHTNPVVTHEFVEQGIKQLERDGFYALPFAETHPIDHLFWVIHMHRIEDAFDAARDAAGKNDRKRLRDLLNMHLARRSRGATAS